MDDIMHIPSPTGMLHLRPERDGDRKFRCRLIELGDERIVRIVVDRPGTMVHTVDQAVVAPLRGRGGTFYARLEWRSPTKKS
jgi:hypothetical protein